MSSRVVGNSRAILWIWSLCDVQDQTAIQRTLFWWGMMREMRREESMMIGPTTQQHKSSTATQHKSTTTPWCDGQIMITEEEERSTYYTMLLWHHTNTNKRSIHYIIRWSTVTRTCWCWGWHYIVGAARRFGACSVILLWASPMILIILAPSKKVYVAATWNYDSSNGTMMQTKLLFPLPANQRSPKGHCSMCPRLICRAQRMDGLRQQGSR